MNEKYIVNYYTGSVGDALISHIFPNIMFEYCLKEKVYTIHNVLKLKSSDISFWKNQDHLEKLINDYFNNSMNNVISSHRFESVDFLKFYPNCKVLSIDPTDLEEKIVERSDILFGDRYPNMKSTFNKKIKKIREMKQWTKKYFAIRL
jgi:hypothetical protein